MHLRRGCSLPALNAVILSTLSLAQNVCAQQQKVLAPHKRTAPKLEDVRDPRMPSRKQSLVGGYWMTNASFSSSLFLSNGVKTSSITVTPVLHLSNGVEYSLTAVTLEPSGTAVVNLNRALQDQDIAAYATLSGYVEVQYDWPWAAVCATVRNFDGVHSLVFAYGLQPPPAVAPVQAPTATAPSPQKLEGIWWKQESNVTGFLAMSNVTGKPIDVYVQITDNGGRNLSDLNLTVTPHGTKTVNLTELLGATSSMGGVLLTHNGPEGGLVVNGGLEDEAAGYSARLPIMSFNRHVTPPGSTATASPEMQKSSYAELGLMVGAADPMMNFPAGTVFDPYSLLRNVSERLVVVSPTLWWMEGAAAHSAPLAQLTVSPHQTQSLDLSTLIAAAGLKNFNGSVNLVLDTQGPKGGLLMASGSVDRRNTYVFEVTPRAILESVAKNLAHWSTGNGDDTMVTVWNPADEEQQFNFTLFFSGGHYGYPIHLGPRATQVFNVSEIIHNQIPDAQGNTIPAAVHEGSAKISGAQGDNEHILVAMDAGTYNVRKATCNQECTTCDGVVSSFVDASPFAVAKGGTLQEAFIEEYNNGDQYDATNISSWSSSDGSIATVDSGGVVSGVNAGSFSIGAFDYTQEPGYDVVCAGGEAVECPFSYVYPSGNGSGTTVWVTLSFRNGYGQSPSTDDAAGGQYISSLGSIDTLGTFFSTGISAHIWRTGVEIIGTVSPSNFTGTITLQRQVDLTCTYNVSTLIHPCSSAFPDTSDPSFRDDDPQSGGSNGKVYDLDAPGLGSAPSNPVNTLLRIRTNFHQWATLNGARVSDDLQWFSRISIIKTNSGDILSNDIPNDNTSGTGTTNTSWNLQ